MTYTQVPLALDATSPAKVTTQARAPTRAYHTVPLAVPARFPTHSGGRLPDDLWNEYQLECAMRERLQLPAVSLAESTDMRDWTDYGEENHQ